MSKGQVQAITVVLLTGLTIGAASVVYVWGEPILNKRESQVQLDKVEKKVLDLRSEIIRVSEAGEGASAKIDLAVDESDYEIRMVKVNQKADYIDVIVGAKEAPYPDNKWTLLRGDTLQNLSISSGDYGIKGKDKGSVLMVKPQAASITYRIEFRNLYSKNEEGASLEKVDLTSDGGAVSSGEAEVHIENMGTVLDTGADGLTISSGQTLDRERVKVEIDLR